MESLAQAPVREGDLLANKYRVEQVLGVGGMGIVVAARHIDLDTRVALKFLLPTAMESEEMVGRFLNEGRAVVRLKSEHVAKVLDVGRLDDGAPYIVMELLQGQDLGAVMKERGRLAIDDATSFVLQACEAVGEAHGAKIIHRDLKPQNLFLTQGVDGAPFVKVLDFGISKIIAPVSADSGDAMTLTRTQTMLGSPLYMSPEQMRSSKHVDARSDVWSFGVILYELITGVVPFLAETMPELVFKIAENEAPDPRIANPAIPEPLALAITRCLQKDVDKRWNNVGELAAAIEPYASPRDRGLAARVMTLVGSQQRARAMSFSDVSAVRVTPVIATSDAWGNTRAEPAPKRSYRRPLIAGALAFAAFCLRRRRRRRRNREAALDGNWSRARGARRDVAGRDVPSGLELEHDDERDAERDDEHAGGDGVALHRKRDLRIQRRHQFGDQRWRDRDPGHERGARRTVWNPGKTSRFRVTSRGERFFLDSCARRFY